VKTFWGKIFLRFSKVKKSLEKKMRISPSENILIFLREISVRIIHTLKSLKMELKERENYENF